MLANQKSRWCIEAEMSPMCGQTVRWNYSLILHLGCESVLNVKATSKVHSVFPSGGAATACVYVSM